jgi:hypothetical protein
MPIHRGAARLPAALALAFGLAPALAAHEGHRHQALGTVTAIDANRLELATREGGTATFTLTESTRYRRGEEAAAREEVEVGERAAVTYEEKGGARTAIEVRLGANGAGR